VVNASREIAAPPERIFELVADPAAQPRWDGNDNLAWAPAGQRVRRAGDVFMMTLSRGSIRENHVTEFEEGRRIAWMPAEVGRQRPGHPWRWELEPAGPSRTRVTCTYDPSWLRLVRISAAAGNGFEGLSEVVGEGVGGGDGLSSGLDLDGAVAAGGLDEPADGPSGPKRLHEARPGWGYRPPG
jgi:uncharacterized protein YndB with AHSA1/START domain